MKDIILTIFCLFCVSSYSYSQNSILHQKIDLRLKNQTIFQSLKKIESKLDISFSFNSSELKKEKKKITKAFRNKSIQVILTFILNGTEWQIKEIANQITIYKPKKTENTKYSLSGFLMDRQSKEKLIGARLYFPSLKVWCNSNSYGYYYIQVPAGNYNVFVDYIGMKTKSQNLTISANLRHNFELEHDTLMLELINVTDQKDEDLKKESDVSIGLEKISIDPKLLELIPSSNGLPDVTKYIQNIAGIQPRYDGSSAFQVRGLSNGNNLILLDEIPIYHPNHLLGIHSIINANAVKSINIYKDYIPAKFGLRNSSVLQIYTKEGNMKKFHGSGGLGAEVLNVSLEGPIAKDKASFYISARQSFYAANTSRRFFPSDLPTPNFYDVTVKLNYKINYKNRIYLTSYFGKDQINTEEETTITNFSFVNNAEEEQLKESISWGNNAFSFRWNKIISDKVFTNLTVVNSTFNYNSELGVSFGQRIISSQAKYDFTYFKTNNTKITFGGSILNTRTQSNELLKERIFLNRNSYETGLYASLNQKINSNLSLNLGLRLPFHHHIGTQDTSVFLQSDFTEHTIVYNKNTAYDFKFSIDPRFLLSYKVNRNNSLQLSMNVATQLTHILNYNTKILPVQIWINPSKYLKPQRNYQTSAGWHSKLKNFSTSTIAYYRFVSNVIDFANVNLIDISSIESRLLSGNLKSYGTELSVQYQKQKKYSAKLSYTYNRSQQTIKGINNGEPYAPDYSRPHYFSFNQYFVKSIKWEFGINFTFHSPTAITLPTSKNEVNGVEIPIYGTERNKSYLPYHDRLDLSAKRTLGIKKQKNRGYLLFTITNFYGSQNISNAYPNYIVGNNLSIVEQNYIPLQTFLYYVIKL